MNPKLTASCEGITKVDLTGRTPALAKKPIQFIWLLFLLSLSFLQRVNATTQHVNGAVLGHWATDSVIVDGDIMVAKGNTLLIDGGTKVIFSGTYLLTIEGNVVAKGTANNPILFTSNDTTGFNGPEFLIGGWKGIAVKSLDEPSVFKYCQFEYMNENVPIHLEIYQSVFDHCNFYNNKGMYILSISRSTNIIKNCIFSHNNGFNSTVFIEGFPQDTIEFKNNTIVYNEGPAIYHLGYIESVLNIKDCILWDNDAVDLSLDKEIMYFPYSEVEFHKSTVTTQNCIIKKGKDLPFFNQSCLDQEPLFDDTANFDFTPSWNSYPKNDQYKSVAIDHGYFEDLNDPDSSRGDIGAVAYFNKSRQSQPWAKFSFKEIPATYFNTYQFTNLSSNTENATFKWDFGDGLYSTKKNPTHAYGKNGLYTVKLTLESGSGFKDSLIVYNAFQVYVGQRITAGEVEGVWKKELGPYYVHGNITIPDGKKLEIEPGVDVKFMGPYNLDVLGSLVAIGTAADSIRFMAFDTTGMALHKGMNVDYPYGEFQAGKGWGGIHVVSTPAENDSCMLSYCKISDVRTGENNAQLYPGALKLYDLKKAIIQNCYICNNITVPCYNMNSQSLSPRLLQNAGIHGIGTSAVIKNNRFENLFEWGPAAIYMGKADSISITGNYFYNIDATAVGLHQINHYTISHNIFDSVAGFCVQMYDADTKLNKGRLNHITHNTFSNSITAMYAQSGGFGVRNTLIAYNVIHDNRSSRCAGFYIFGDKIYLVNNLFYGNTKTLELSTSEGACVDLNLVGGKQAIIASNTFVDNGMIGYQPIIVGDKDVRIYNNVLQDGNGPELEAKTFINNQTYSTNFDSVFNNNIKGSYPTGNGNIDVDPGFMNRSAHNYALASTSAMINQGHTFTDTLRLPGKDLAGLPRLDKYANKVDMGAYEFQPEAPGAFLLTSDSFLVKMMPNTLIGGFQLEQAKKGYSISCTLIDDENDHKYNNKDFVIRNNQLYSTKIFTESHVIKHIRVRATNNFEAVIDSTFSIYIDDNPFPEKPFGIQLVGNRIQAGAPENIPVGKLITLDFPDQYAHIYTVLENKTDPNSKTDFKIEGDSLFTATQMPSMLTLRQITIRTTNLLGEYFDSTVQVMVIPAKKIAKSAVISIFPNPFKQTICILPSQNQLKGTWQLFSTSGLQITNGGFMGKTYVSLDNLPIGIYFLKVITAEGQQFFKVVKE